MRLLATSLLLTGLLGAAEDDISKVWKAASNYGEGSALGKQMHIFFTLHEEDPSIHAFYLMAHNLLRIQQCIDQWQTIGVKRYDEGGLDDLKVIYAAHFDRAQKYWAAFDKVHAKDHKEFAPLDLFFTQGKVPLSSIPGKR